MIEDLVRRRLLKISAATFTAGAIGGRFPGCGFQLSGGPASGIVEKTTLPKFAQAIENK